MAAAADPQAAQYASESEEVNSLPSISSSILDDEDDDAQREWEESLEQLQMISTLILIPFVGKFLGRKFAYYSWGRYMEWFHGVDIRWSNKNAAGVVAMDAVI